LEDRVSENVKNKIERLKRDIRFHDRLYYVLSDPKISDKEYDVLLKELQALEDKYPQYKTEDSPTVRLSGGILKGFRSIRHVEKMYSLDNTYSFDEIYSWKDRVLKNLPDGKISYVAELKIDGVSANLTYRNGKLISAATRGDGQTGEDITENIKRVRSIPLTLSGDNLPEFIEVRGEVYMEKQSLSNLNRQREAAGEPIFANPRNAASGSLKLLDSEEVAKRRLLFYAHSLGAYSGVKLSGHFEFLQKLKYWGIRVNEHVKLCHTIEDVIEYCKLWQGKREGLAYEIDGAVIKVDNLEQQHKLGFTLKSPRWAIAYKFPARQATTEVMKIVFQVGRTGVITPVAELKPVECGGVIIKHATLHNFDEIERLGIREHDRVLIERAGEVIPKIIKVIERRGKSAVRIPKECPVCSGKVIKEKEEDVAYRCINPNCGEQLQRSILHFASRQAMDIEGMGEAVVSQLIGLKLVGSFSDIYRLKGKDLSALELFKEKKINNLLSAIDASRHRPLSRLIYGLGIRHVGEKAAYVLASKFGSINKLAAADMPTLQGIHEVGPIMAESIVDYFAQPQAKKLIEEFSSLGLNLKEEAKKTKNTPLTGKRVVFTGELKNFSRQEAEELVRQNGGYPISSVSKATDFVVAGDNPGSKYNNARKMNIRILNEQEFERFLK